MDLLSQPKHISNFLTQLSLCMITHRVSKFAFRSSHLGFQLLISSMEKSHRIKCTYTLKILTFKTWSQQVIETHPNNTRAIFKLLFGCPTAIFGNIHDAIAEADKALIPYFQVFHVGFVKNMMWCKPSLLLMCIRARMKKWKTEGNLIIKCL